MYYLIKYKDGHKIFPSKDYVFLASTARKNNRTLDEEITYFLMNNTKASFTQSDSVFDLIEEGDFLELNDKRWLFKVLKDSKGLYFYHDRFLKHYVLNNNVQQNIKKIYKPNSDGDLHLVWTKEVE